MYKGGPAQSWLYRFVCVTVKLIHEEMIYFLVCFSRVSRHHALSNVQQCQTRRYFLDQVTRREVTPSAFSHRKIALRRLFRAWNSCMTKISFVQRTHCHRLVLFSTLRQVAPMTTVSSCRPTSGSLVIIRKSTAALSSCAYILLSDFSLKLRSRGAVTLIRSLRFLKVARKVGECSLIGKTCHYSLRGHVRVLLQAAFVWRYLLFFLQISRLALRKGRGAWRSVLRALQESSVDVRTGGCPRRNGGNKTPHFCASTASGAIRTAEGKPLSSSPWVYKISVPCGGRRRVAFYDRGPRHVDGEEKQRSVLARSESETGSFSFSFDVASCVRHLFSQGRPFFFCLVPGTHPLRPNLLRLLGFWRPPL